MANTGYPTQQVNQPPGTLTSNFGGTSPPPGSGDIHRQAQAQPNDYLVLAIFVTICCFLPTGIVAIVMAMKVRRSYEAGNIEESKKASSNAKMWSLISLIIGLVISTVYAIVQVVSAANSSS